MDVAQLVSDAKFMALGGDSPPSCSTANYTIDINASCRVVYDSFIAYTWRQGGGLGDVKVLALGNEVDGEGCVRDPGLGLREVIVRTNKDCRVLYSIPKGMPCHLYRGIVQFDALGNGATRITWHSEFEPYFLIGRPFILTLVNYAFPKMLANLKKYVESSKL